MGAPTPPRAPDAATKVPAVTRAVGVLQVLAAHPDPVRAATIARQLELPRSTVYQLLAALEAAGLVAHLPEERGYGLAVGVFELGAAYLRNEPLERVSRPLLSRLVEQVEVTAHLGVLHGRETLYLLKEQPIGATPLVTAVGVRLPAHLTASGRAMLAHLPAAQVRALYPDAAAFVDRTGAGPRRPATLRWLLADERARGWAEEDGQVTPGLASVAAAVFDHQARPVASIGLTFASDDYCAPARRGLAERAVATAALLTRRLSGRRPPAGAGGG
jgi:DNA-binding IclR family transcriptional regulator